MTKLKKLFFCTSCEYESTQWLGQCPSCEQWNSLEEKISQKNKLKDFKKEKSESYSVTKVSNESYERIKTNINEFDRVMGGGVVNGSLILIGGEPGIGKSTLLTEILGRFANLFPENVLYISGEESVGQVAERANRIGVDFDNFFILHENSWEDVLEEIKKIKPTCIVLDSIQTISSNNLQSPPGAASQIREVTYELMNYTKSKDITCFVIGHITKDGSIAGPKLLEHMVDTVIYFEGDRFGHYRLLRVIKNRFGSTNNVGIFEMKQGGLLEVNNPSQYFIKENSNETQGTAVSCLLEGTRPLFVEVQALVVENKFGNGRRVTQGIDQNRLSMLIAVIEKYFEINLTFNDIYLNVAGGIKVNSNDIDLSVVAALISSYKNRILSKDKIFIGEVGLTGEVRSVSRIENRLKEIDQLKYKEIYLSKKHENEYSKNFNINFFGLKDACQIMNCL